MSQSSVYSLWSWITTTCVQAICCIVQIFILKHEWNKRRNSDILFTSKYARFFSLSCMLCGILYTLLAALQFINGFCYFAFKLYFTILSMQSISMGIYQLDRLWYTFSINQVYSKHGYPLCLYYLMLAYVVLVVIGAILAPWAFLNVSTGKCFIAADGSYHDSLNQRWSSFESFIFPVLFYLIWDYLTLALYVRKALYLRKYASGSPQVHERIMKILLRILICTILYEVAYAVDAAIVGLTILLRSQQSGDSNTGHAIMDMAIQLGCGVYSVCVSYAMLLMQEHNTSEYGAFLRVVSRMRMYYVCCICCVSTSEVHLSDYLKGEQDGATVPETPGPELERKATQNTTYQTCDEKSVKMEHSQPAELSVETAGDGFGADCRSVELTV